MPVKVVQKIDPLMGRLSSPVAAPSGEALKAGSVVEFMVMPAGVHSAWFGQGGKPTQRTVAVDRAAASNLEAQLKATNASGKQRAYFDFDHEDGPASAWPESFFWREQPAPGIYCRALLSEAGATAIAGRNYRAFSPVFFTTPKPDPAKVICQAGAGLNFGSLVNDPAFKEINPLWSKNTQNPIANMPKDKTAISAKISELEQEINGLLEQGQTTDVTEPLKAKREELEREQSALALLASQERNQELEQALLQNRTKEADAAVRAAVARGALPAKDEALQGKWRGWVIENPDMLSALNGLRGQPALNPIKLTQSVQIVKEDTATVLKAFADERDPIKRAAIYAKQIRPRYDEGDPLPLKGATMTLGTLVGTLTTQRTLELLKLQFPILRSISTDFSDQSASYGQTIATRIVTVPTVGSYSTSTGWTDADETTTDATVVLNNHKGVPITFNAQTLASTARRLFDEIAPAQAYALAKDMVDSLYALYTAANYTNAATAASLIDFGRPTLIDVGVALDGRGVPDGPMNRFAILNSSYFGQLKKDSAIISLASFQERQIIEQGVLPDIEGFRVIKGVNMPSTANLVGFAGSKSSQIIVTRLDNDYASVLPGASNGNVTTVTDPDLGISVLQVQYVDHQLATATQRISLLYGVAKGQINAGQLIKSA